MGPEGLVSRRAEAQNVLVTIIYSNGAVLEAVVLSHEDLEIRAIAAGCDEVLVLRRVHGTWISEDLEPVTLRFAWDPRPAVHSFSENDCICPKELAAHLIQSLLAGSDLEEMSNKLYVRPKGSRFTHDPSDLRVS